MDAQRIAEGVGFVEGPCIGADGALIFTVIDRGQVCRLDADGTVTRLATCGGGPNGATLGGDGSVYIAQNGGRGTGHTIPTSTGGVQVVSPDGRLRWLTQDLISPNDICFGPDGMLWVTDPTRGRFDDSRLWKVDPVTGDSTLLLSVPWYMNGLGFAPDASRLLVASTGDKRLIWFDVDLDRGGVTEAGVFAQLEVGSPDGFAFDVDGNVIVACVNLDGDPGQIQVWSAGGDLLDVRQPSDSPFITNVALDADSHLYVTDSTGHAILRYDWPTRGLPLHTSI